MSESSDGTDTRVLVNQLLHDALTRRASDLHIEPLVDSYEIRLRIDGLLQTIARHDPPTGRAIVTRLMVLAQLLTYRMDVPQEGRLSIPHPTTHQPLEFRLAIIPTTHGIRAAVRTPADLLSPRTLSDLLLPPPVTALLEDFAKADSGMLLITGPAGSGKTTTLYSLLDHIVRSSPGLSVVSLEDPVERDLPGVTQIEVRPFGDLTYERALRSILRQDPQVLMLGEIRDADTARIAVQAALSGHRLCSTFHAASPESALARLLEMGLEPYQLTSALFGIVTQRLLRRKTPAGYSGRLPIAESIRLDAPLRQALLSRSDAPTLRASFQSQPHYISLSTSAANLLHQNLTDQPEIDRVLGPS
ncbi:MAG TPA: ATPase, T2SS/T4P/T4SS family [Tepidisphaeraceae bacterium]|jgi:general secretion pathway protein E|nr:ATPase, T2SS/T4P/T4SS family [Tepidisphaeraceae bacterium]